MDRSEPMDVAGVSAVSSAAPPSGQRDGTQPALAGGNEVS